MNRTQMITVQVSDLVEPLLADMGFELVDVEYLPTQGRWVLRLFIDKTGGVTIEDCARVSGEVGDLIDVRDIVDHEYTLEVSSPGLDRVLKKEKDFVQAIGKKVKVRTLSPVEGRRNFTGRLRDFREDTLYLDSGAETTALPRSEVEKANLIYEFGQ